MSRQVNVPAETFLEEIQSFEEHPSAQYIRVTVGKVDSDDVFIVPQQYSVYIIKDDMYIELNSANPSWNTSKPAGTYFNDDLWHFIDLLNQT
jgi:hypothetical protein